MGRLIDGRWSTQDLKTDGQGHFVREQTRFRRQISRAGAEFPAVAGRYHLYVSLACPWAHRTLVMRKLKGLEHAISVNIVHPVMGANGWQFGADTEGLVDTVNGGVSFLYEIYALADPHYTGRVTVPVLWDKTEQTIVSNESRDIVRMLDCEFEAVARVHTSFCPEDLQKSIDETIDALYPSFNNGVYRAGFAKTQLAYEESVAAVFVALEGFEQRLAGQRYLCGGALTEADIFFYTTLVRFDPVYHYHFKCNLKRIADFPNVANYLRDIYQLPAFRETTDFAHIKRHYYMSHDAINPSHIIPIGPIINLDGAHDRARFH